MPEIDALVVCEGVVLVNETKGTLTSRDVDDLIAEVQSLADLLPELAEHRPVGVLVSLYVDEVIVPYAMRRGVLRHGREGRHHDHSES